MQFFPTIEGQCFLAGEEWQVLPALNAIALRVFGSVGLSMTRQIKGDDAQIIGSKCIQVKAPTYRTAGKAVQHDQRWSAFSGFAALFNSKLYTIHLHNHTFHVQFLAPTPRLLRVFSMASQSWRCILTLLVRSVGTSIICSPPV